jgi:cytochrome b involved in lipid metabolism
MNSKTYTLDEVKTHNSEGDCWIIIDGKVYDVSGFTDKHPGGSSALSKNGGLDATAGFIDVNHSPDAHKLAE